MTRKNEKTTPEDNQARDGKGENVHNRPPQTCRHSDPATDEGLGKKFHNPTDAERYAWLRSGGFFHHAMGRVGPSYATDDEFDALVDKAMARDAIEAEAEDDDA